MVEEKDFIREPNGNQTIWWIVFLGVAALLASGVNWFYSQVDQKIEKTPFMDVSNRDFSLFLWQNPEYMKMYHKDKVGYLPDFYSDKAGLKSEYAEKEVKAYPLDLFLYHTWSRLIKSETPIHPVSRDLLTVFLKQNPEWSPDNWKGAPSDWKSISQGTQDAVTLPLDVQIAFNGWHTMNYLEKEFNAARPTYNEFLAFVKGHPHYARNYWRNLHPAYPGEEGKGDDEIPLSAMPLFLRLALFQNKAVDTPKPASVPLP